MQINSQNFKLNAHRALADARLQSALARAKSGFIDKRSMAVSSLPEFDALCDEAKQIKDHTLQYLDFYLERYENKVIENGGQVHWAENSADACRLIVDLCQQHHAKTVTKGKSMVAEEISLNDALTKVGIEPVETDLGEYIVQLAEELPSHIIAPAVHKTREQISALFYKHHKKFGYQHQQSKIPDMVDEVRAILREKFQSADVGITGANFLIAETGASVIVTNEGNGDLTCTLPRVHIVVAGIEKIVPSLNDVSTLLRVLARSATGQEMSAYTTFSNGPKRVGDIDGPEHYHVVLIDNGRTELLGNEFREMLRCIRCGACLNHCPVYSTIGGHAYGSVYPGPMGSVLTPALEGLENTMDLPNACTLNGRCEIVCPVRIPLPQLLRTLRVKQFKQKLTTKTSRFALFIWAFFAKRPKIYQAITSLIISILDLWGRSKEHFRRLPFSGGWTKYRDFPIPQQQTFMSLWKQHENK